MADKEVTGKKRQIKKTQTVRQRAEKASGEKKPRRIKQAGATAVIPFKKARAIGQKEFNPVKLPDNKVGRFMTKRRKVVPSYFRNSWIELKKVVWPGTRETAKLTLAVFLFAIFIGTIVTVTDYGLDKLFKNVILK